MRVAGLILAGGAARRLGGIDKPLLRLGGVTLLDRIAARLRPQADCLALSANGDPMRFDARALPVLADRIPGLGPLGGIARGLAWAAEQGCAALLSVPGDTPFIPADLARRLAPAPAVAASAGRLHHAVALWPVSCLAALEAHLAADGRRSISGFARTLPMRRVDFEFAAPIDPFFNINQPSDLREAEALLAAPSSPVPRPG